MDYNEFLAALQKKLTAEKLRQEIQGVYEMSQSKEKRKAFNDEMVNKTWQYQKEYGFEVSPRKGHEFWNNQADAFKHAFGSAQMSSDFGLWGSLAGGIDHENRLARNPKNEWNMDSWNNHQGREIYKEIQKEYGNSFEKFTQQERDNIIAAKVMSRMKNGQLITNPNDSRTFGGFIEVVSDKLNKLFQQGQPTGFAAPMPQSQIPQPKIFTPEDIGNMTREEFDKNEKFINEQLQQGLITPTTQRKQNYSGYRNPVSGDNRIFSQEDIGGFSGDEFAKHEKEIRGQWGSIGIPTNNELQSSGAIYIAPYTRSDGVQVKGHYRSR